MSPQAIAETYTTEVLSGYDFFKPEILEKLFRKYGDQGMSYFQTLRLMGFETPVANDTYSHFEENRTHEVFHVGSAGITGATAGVAKTVTLEGSDLGAGGTGAPLNTFYPRLNDVVMFPNETTALITDVNISTPSAPIITMAPLDDTKSIPVMASGDPIIIISSLWSEQSGQPTGAVKGTTKYENDAQIIKETISTSGTNLVTQTWFTKYGDTGKSIVGYWTVGLLDIDFRMNLKIDGALLFGERVTTLTDAVTGHAYKGTQGLFPYIRANGDVEEIAEGAFSVTDFDTIDRYLDQQGVSKQTLVMPGINRHQELENTLKAYFQDTNINYTRDVVNSEIFNGSKSKAASVNFKLMGKSERTFMFKRFNNMNNPKTYGVTNAEGVGAYEMPNYAVFLPVGTTKDAKSRKLVNNIGCRYRTLGGYSRRMEVFNLGGAGTGLKVSQIDELNTYMRSHMGAHHASGNQMVLVSPALV